jgi:hypothetical protein
MNKFIAILITLAVAITAQGRNVADFFKLEKADNAIPLLSQNTRLDMVDYFDNGLPHTSSNNMDGSARIISADNNTINFEITSETPCALSMITAKSDTILMMVETIKLPQSDSNISFYSKNWEALKREAFTAPKLADWLTATGKSEREDVEIWLPFMLWQAEYANNTLTLTNTLNEYYVDESDLAKLSKWILPKLTYRYNGKKFVLAK